MLHFVVLVNCLFAQIHSLLLILSSIPKGLHFSGSLALWLPGKFIQWEELVGRLEAGERKISRYFLPLFLYPETSLAVAAFPLWVQLPTLASGSL